MFRSQTQIFKRLFKLIQHHDHLIPTYFSSLLSFTYQLDFYIAFFLLGIACTVCRDNFFFVSRLEQVMVMGCT